MNNLEPFIPLLEYLYNLEYSATPNYEYLRTEISEIIIKVCHEHIITITYSLMNQSLRQPMQ
jgi:hypothetical protein